MTELAATLVLVLPPLVAVPLTIITFYLRSLREHQLARHGELVRQVETLADSVSSLRERHREFERDYTTKEEWVRETTQLRRRVEIVGDAIARMDPYSRIRHYDELDTSPSIAAHPEAVRRKTAKILDPTRRDKDDV